MSKLLNDYSLPALGETITELNRFGSVIAGSLYFLIVAMVLVFIVHWLSKRFLFPRLVNKRFAVVLTGILAGIFTITTVTLPRIGAASRRPGRPETSQVWLCFRRPRISGRPAAGRLNRPHQLFPIG
jgi:hypothetical protein